MTCLVEAV